MVWQNFPPLLASNNELNRETGKLEYLYTGSRNKKIHY
jgi:hypothetical protein